MAELLHTHAQVPACVREEGVVSSVFRKLKVSPLKGLYKYYTSETISLAGGLPMEKTFPIKQVDVHLGDEDIVFSLKNSEGLFQNYHRGDGIPAVKAWFRDHVKSMHATVGLPIDTCVTIGSTDAWAKVLELIDTDVVLFDKFAYGQSVSMSETVGKRNVGVETDANGMIPSALRETTLTARAQGLKVNLLYLVPIGQNPTGTTMPEARKREIYDVCKELDLIIVEDDAYYYLYFELFKGEPTGLQGLPLSFLSLDTDGRVLRLDSLSKFVAPGMRMGFISGPTEFIEKFMLLQEATSQFPSGLSQSVFFGLVSTWGPDGLQAHILKTQQHYRNQCLAMVTALREYFPVSASDPQLCQYVEPSGGMFVWLSFPTLQGQMSSFEVFEALASAGVICVPGSGFAVPPLACDTGVTSKLAPAVRITYAAAEPDLIKEGVKRLADCIKKLCDLPK